MANPHPKTDHLPKLKKGYDPRRGKGRPRSAKALADRMALIGSELLVIQEKIKVIDPETDKIKYEEVTYELTRLDAMIRMMYSSKSPADRKEILDRMVGKVTQGIAVQNPDGSNLIPDVDEVRGEILGKLAGLAASLGAGTIPAEPDAKPTDGA